MNPVEARYHSYWIVDDCPLAEFPLYQKAIARRFDSDPKVHDLPRVMRLPGFYHCKGTPYPTHVIDLNWAHTYKRSQVREGLQLELDLHGKPMASSGVASDRGRKYGATQGFRNDSLFKMACAMRGRGEYAVAEVMACASACNPPLPEEEAVQLLNHVWSRY